MCVATNANKSLRLHNDGSGAAKITSSPEAAQLHQVLLKEMRRVTWESETGNPDLFEIKRNLYVNSKREEHRIYRMFFSFYVVFLMISILVSFQNIH